MLIHKNNKINFSTNNCSTRIVGLNNIKQTQFLPDIFKKSSITPSFEGLTKAFKTRSLSQQALEEIINRDKNPVVGNLPFDWISNLNLQTKEKDIREILSAFSNASNVLNNTIKFKFTDNGDWKPELIYKGDIETASEKLNTVFKKVGLINQMGNFKLDFLAYGTFGCLYKFEIANRKYVLKVFYDIDPAIATQEYLTRLQYYKKEGSGILNETNRSALIKNLAPYSQYGESLFSNVKDKYSVFEFQDAKSKNPKKYFHVAALNLESHDDDDEAGKNYIINANNKRIIIDYGGLEQKIPDLKDNKIAVWVRNKIFSTPINEKENQWNNLYTEKRPNKKEQLLGLLLSISSLPYEKQPEYLMKYMKDNKLNQEEKRVIAYTLGIIPEINKLEVLKTISEDVDKAILLKIANSFGCISKKDRYEALQILLSNTKEADKQEVFDKAIIYFENEYRKNAQQLNPSRKI